MGVSIGGMDIGRQGLDNEFRIGVLERLVELVIRRSGIGISAADMDRIRQETFAQLQARYPQMGLRFEQGEQG